MRQQKVAPPICPRCEVNYLKHKDVYNSKSRKNGMSICNDCGTAEAMRDWMRLDPWPTAPNKMEN